MATALPIPTTFRFKDMTGQRFGRLIVESYAGARNGSLWNCLCDCGNRKVVNGTHLRRGLIQSCRCLQREVVSERHTRHGKSATPEHKSWAGMWERCNDLHYPNYGGRGIRVCDRWKMFENFLDDMGSKPTPKHSIDRINNDGNYEPGNCRWATRETQMNNTSRSVRLNFRGRAQTMKQWALETGIPYYTINSRHQKGWSDEAILTTPTTKRRHRKGGRRTRGP